MDEFERLVAEAKGKLSAQEGREVSWRELGRRAGYADAGHSGFAYHVRPQKGRAVHQVPPELIDALAPVLATVVSRTELMWAAATAAGYELPRPGE